MEKAALRLIIHTHYHCNSTSANISKQPNSKSPKVSSIHCDCIDDFFVPVEKVEQIIFSDPALFSAKKRMIQYQSSISTTFQISLRLRGPPLMV